MGAPVSAIVVNQPKPSGKALTWGMLKQTHPSYDGELWEKLDLLWQGGWAIRKHAEKFIPRAPDEPTKFYKWRLSVTSYVNYFARLVGFLGGSLFNESLNIGAGTKPNSNEPLPLPDEEFYEAFANDCDQRGTDFSQFIRAEVLVRAMVWRRALVQVDLPEASIDADTLAEEDAAGQRRAYLIPLDIESMYYWAKDPRGNFTWCILHGIYRDESSPFADRSRYQHEFKLWSMQGGVANFMVLRTKPIKDESELQDEDELQVVQEMRATSFKQIPILELELPDALWVGNQTGTLCMEHYQGRSDLKGSICRNLVEIPYVKRGPEVPPVHQGVSETQMDPNRGADPVGQAKGKGWVAIGSEDELGFAGPSGVSHQIASQELKDIREEIFASVNAMSLQLENSASALSRSGESKSEDKSALETLLTYMGTQTREFAQKLMTVVSEARGETVKWVATGLSTFDQEDRGELVAEAAIVAALSIPSPTHRRIYLTKVAHATVPNASAEQKREIETEIQNNVSDEEVSLGPIERAEAMTKAQNPEPSLGDGGDDGPPKKGAPPSKAGAGKGTKGKASK